MNDMLSVKRDELADNVGFTSGIYNRLGVGWSKARSAWTIPERAPNGEVVGIQFRDRRGRKWGFKGSRRGLIIPSDLIERGPLFIAEGMSDTAALLYIRFNAIGRPNSTGGVVDVVSYVRATRPKRVVVCADNDRTGLKGAVKLAVAVRRFCRDVRVIKPPRRYKDMREWINAGGTREDVLRATKDAERVEEEATDDADQVDMVALADIPLEPLAWLWPGWIPAGKLSLVVGDPGLGKSILMSNLSGRVSTGRKWPDKAPNTPGAVILLSAEDDPADTIRPRLESARADVNRVHIVRGIKRAGGGRSVFSLERDLPALEAAIRRVPDVRLVIIDPISAYMGRVDSHNNTEVRGLLAMLADFAARHRVAVLAVSHLNKAPGGRAIYRTMGSLAFAAAARAVLLVVEDKDDPKRRNLIPLKCNLAAKPPGIGFRVVDGGAVFDSKPVDISADDALAEEDADHRSAVQGAADFLRMVLADGPKPARSVLADAKENGIATKTIHRAKKIVGVRIEKEHRPRGSWIWSLPTGNGHVDHLDHLCNGPGKRVKRKHGQDGQAIHRRSGRIRKKAQAVP